MSEQPRNPALPQDVQEPVAWQMRVAGAAGSWFKWDTIDRDEYDLYRRNPQQSVQIRALYAAPPDLEITKAEIMAIGDTVTMLRKMGHRECSEDEIERVAEAIRLCSCERGQPVHPVMVRHLAVAAIEAMAPQSSEVTIPPGYKLVPLIPTPAMVEIGCENNPTQWTDETDDKFAADVANDVYVSMVRAAISPVCARPKRPFHGAECSSYPNCNGGCGLGCTKEMEQLHAPGASPSKSGGDRG